VRVDSPPRPHEPGRPTTGEPHAPTLHPSGPRSHPPEVLTEHGPLGFVPAGGPCDDSDVDAS